MNKQLKKLIQHIITEEFAPAPKFGDIGASTEENKDRPGMEGRPDDPMDVSQFKTMMWAESDEHKDDDDEEELEEACAISGGGAGLAASGQVSATSGGSGWETHQDEHEMMWSGDEPEKNK